MYVTHLVKVEKIRVAFPGLLTDIPPIVAWQNGSNMLHMFTSHWISHRTIKGESCLRFTNNSTAGHDITVYRLSLTFLLRGCSYKNQRSSATSFQNHTSKLASGVMNSDLY